MPRTTINLDAPVLRDLKRLQKREGKPLGQLVSELLAQALRSRDSINAQDVEFTWITRPMHARVDLTDNDAVQAALDGDAGSAARH